MSDYSRGIKNRMARCSGHLNSVKKMIDEDRDYTEVMMQLSAVRSSLNGVTNAIMKEQIRKELVEAVKNNDMRRVEEINNTISKYF